MKNREEWAKKDLEFVLAVDDWPMYPYLPMKTHGGHAEMRHGVLIAGRGPVVFIVNVFDISQQILASAEQVKFESFEELIHYWMVD